MNEIHSVAVIGTGEQAERIAGLLSRSGVPVSTGEPAGQADFVLECLPGDAAAKRDILRRIEQQTRPEAILATTDSGVTALAAALAGPERVLGVSFTFNPFRDACLAQVVKGLATAEETARACLGLLAKAGIEAIAVRESPGLVLDRVMALAVNEAVTMYATRVASAEDIDRVARLCLNWPVGPLQFADIIGLDSVLDTLKLLLEQEGERFRPCRLLREMVAMGWLGKKAGRGFYRYDGEA